MTRVDTLGAARSALAENPVTLLYFSGNDCGVCDAIRPKIEELLAARPRIASFEINIEASPEAAAQFDIFTIPGILLFVHGKETIREARYLSLDALRERIDRYLSLLPEEEPTRLEA